jgi:hypothetical protein
METKTPAWTFKDMSNATPEEYARDREELSRPMSPEKRARALAALEMTYALHRQILERTGGLGIPEEALQEAIDSRHDH